jgi:7-cyano-7-deazaguanine reductase
MAAKSTKPKQLGKPTPIPASPDKALLERVPNPHP